MLRHRRILLLLATLLPVLTTVVLADALDPVIANYKNNNFAYPDTHYKESTCLDHAGDNTPITDFQFEKPRATKPSAPKEPCCPGPCCPDMAGGPVSIPSQQTANG